MTSVAPDQLKSGLPVPNSTHSFWHSEPNEFLLGHHTTPELPSDADVVIVGSGITGSSAARFLAEDPRFNGKNIVMLEAREACWGATGRNGGHCQVLPVARGAEVAQFELLNYNTVKEYVAQNEVPCEWRSLTACRAFFSEAMFKDELNKVAALKAADPEMGKLIEVVTDKAELAKYRVSTAVGCTLCPAAASLWPYKLVAFVLEKLVKAGQLNLQTNTPVERLEPGDGTRPHVLHTPRGAIRTRTVLLCTNGYTSHLLPAFADLIVPVRGEMSSLRPPAGAPRLANSYGLEGQPGQSGHLSDYLNQRPYEGVPNPAGHYMYGGGDAGADFPRVGVWDDSVVDEGMAARLRSTLLRRMELGGEMEGLEELEATHQWTGIMGYSRDNMPWIGEVPDTKGVWLAAGFTGHGMPNGTLCGKAVVSMMLDEEEKVGALKTYTNVVEKTGLPTGYFITEARIEKARKLPPVAKADAEGTFGAHTERPSEGGILTYLKSMIWPSSA
ncbi:FAD dependent oxidoreductase [Rhodofomes roseus]|uniref:FAD dependent oxidoreductase n=1 Tax=Rhodofomes roseus TaxID=34475 RepID=A0ABQ8K7L9_9APHY|nr:FAD dependent oxidoreductase [Rhodofomes roseus]KAH9833162.1 FAD dependent oxidoreductase [Rhodofomes roseus]